MLKENEFTYKDWLQTPPEGYELTEEHRKIIERKVTDLLAICKELGAPVFVAWAVEEDKEKVTMSSAGHMGGPGRAPVELLMMALCDKPLFEWLDHMVFMAMEKEDKVPMV